MFLSSQCPCLTSSGVREYIPDISLCIILTFYARLFIFLHLYKALINKMWSYHPWTERSNWLLRVGNNTWGARIHCARWGRQISNDHSYLPNMYMEFESAVDDGKKEKLAAKFWSCDVGIDCANAKTGWSIRPCQRTSMGQSEVSCFPVFHRNIDILSTFSLILR